MMLSLLLLTLFSPSQGFILDATANHTVEISLPADSVRTMVHRLSTLEAMMPGVIEIAPHAGGCFLYRTEREIPFSGTMQTDFRIVSLRGQDGSVTYRTPGIAEENWMSFRLEPAATSTTTTRLSMRLRVRLVRNEGTEIHLLAPLLGEEYLSKRMEEDLSVMLQLFAERLSHRAPLKHAARY